jgi:O-antigen ligase
VAHVTRGLTASRIGRLALLAAIALLEAYWFLQPVPFAAKSLATSFLFLSLARPDYGLLSMAGLAPLSTMIAGLCGGGTGLGGQLLEQMALSVGAGVLVRPRHEEPRTRLGPPAMVMATVALASASVLVPAAAAPVTRDLDGWLLHQLMLPRTAQSAPIWTPLSAALVIAECGLLGWAVERIIRRKPELALRLVAVALIGHAGAGYLNLSAFVSGARRSPEALDALWRLLTTQRISMQTDVHAAASALVLSGVAGLGLTSGSRTRTVGVALLLAVVGIGLWITGSRVAIVLGAMAACVTIGWLVSRGSRRRRFAVAAVGILAVVAGLWLTLNMREQSTRHGTISNSVSTRLPLAKAGLQMFEENPVFGIGIARFYPSSTGFLRGSLGEDYRENAHNNFLQVLAEQGIVGLGALLWCLAVVVGGGVRAQLSTPSAGRGSLIAAIGACIGTWMTGHPLLVREFAFVFWLYLGVLSAMAPAPPNNRVRSVAWILMAGVLLSVPLRAKALRDAADLEHRGFGVSSLWQHDDDQRYRTAGSEFALYLPATGRPVEVPLRRAPGAPDPLVVDVRIAGRLADTTSVGGDAWQTLSIRLPAGPRRFELVDFFVRTAEGAATGEILLRVGRDAAR